jgi:dihydropteroate synthase
MLWRTGSASFDLRERSLIMGILNVTPDSFSDGGRFHQFDSAVSHGLAMAAAGADIIDIGGESSRPGAEPVEEEEELARAIPVIEALRKQSDVAISIDTMKSGVARAALEAGAVIINDISAFESDPGMIEMAAGNSAGIVLMHMQGNPRTMQKNPSYGDVVEDIRSYLAGRLEALAARGIDAERIALDPGIGFGKKLEHNLDLIRRIGEFESLGRPMLLGPSRKSFLRHILFGEPFPEDWVRTPEIAAATGAAVAACFLYGANIVRVHDVPTAVAQREVVMALRG